MFKNSIKSHFVFSRSEQSGILVLLSAFLIQIGIQYYVNVQEVPLLILDDAELTAIQNELDSLRCLKLEQQKPKLNPFNPNFISEYKAYTLGMTSGQFEALQEFRNKDQWVNSVNQFQKITGVNALWIDSVGPYFKFPDWVRQARKKNFKKAHSELPFHLKKDLNTATAEELQSIPGIGPVLSERIIQYRERLQNFSDDIQLSYVYGIDSNVVQAVLKQFSVKTPKEIKKFNVNQASASDIATIPEVSFHLAKKIWEFVRLRNGIEDLRELTKIEELSKREFALIQLYLFAEKNTL